LARPEAAIAAADAAVIVLANAQAALVEVDPTDTQALLAATTALADAEVAATTTEAAAEQYLDEDAYQAALEDQATAAVAAADEAATAAAIAAEAAEGAPPATDSARVVVFNPAEGGVVTEGGALLIESTFTDTGGMAIQVPMDAEAYAAADAAAAEASADATEAEETARAAAVEAQMAQLAAAAPDADEATIAAAEEAQAAAEEAAADVAAFLQAVAEAEAEKAAQAATVTVSADGTQMQIKDASGFTATSITTDTGVTITMDQEPIEIAMDNLAVGALQRATTAGGETLIARKNSADDDAPVYYNEDGTVATKADGQPYTIDDLVALTLVFEG
jgi:hypothetical protein